MADDTNPFNVINVAANIPPEVQVPDYHAPQMPDQRKANVLPDDHELIIDISNGISSGVSGLQIVAALFTVNALVVIAVWLIAHWKGTDMIKPDISVVIRVYTQQVATTSFIASVLTFFCILWFDFPNENDKHQFCYNSFSQMRLAVGVIVTSMSVGVFRFCAYLFAEKQAAAQDKKTNDNGKSFTDEYSSIFRDNCRVFGKLAVVLILFKFALLFNFVPNSIFDYVNFDICLTKFPRDYSSTFVYSFVILLQQQAAITFTGMIFQNKFLIGVHFMGDVIQKPYSTTSLSLNGFGWSCLLFAMWYQETSAIQSLIFAQLFVMVDSMWALLICIASPNPVRIVSMSKV